MALADVYDALISKRPYKPPYPHEKAVEIITEGKGTHFDPDIVDAFLALGSTFRNIALTFADFDEEREMLDTEDMGGPVEKILLVEDNEINLEIMQSQLLSAGFQVETASDGKEALTKWESGNYDALLTDLEMPEMDGYTLVSKIRGKTTGASGMPPLLAITASDFDLTEERAAELGFDGYLLKPLDLEILKRKLANIPPKNTISKPKP
jgi:putative two-component system response regulator